MANTLLYPSENAQADANAKGISKGRNSKITPKLKNLIEDKLNLVI